ncbi:hypothetical protein A2U01_0030879, partial [Trifolium medium]|nr:hypothetical protein [Trifolium medium]
QLELADCARLLPEFIMRKMAVILPRTVENGRDEQMRTLARNLEVEGCTESSTLCGHAMCDYCGNIEETCLIALRDCALVMPLWMSIVPLAVRDKFFLGDLQQ